MANRQQHPDGTRAQARTVYEQHGPQRASAVTGVPTRTLRRWAEADGWKRPRQPASGHLAHQDVAGVAPSVSVRAAPAKGGSGHGPGHARMWNPRRVLDRLSWELWAELDRLATMREHGKPRDAQPVAVIVGILTQRCLELAKAAGVDASSGHLPPELARERLGELRQVLADRAQWEREHGQPG